MVAPLPPGSPSQWSRPSPPVTPKPGMGPKSSKVVKLGTLSVLSVMLVGFCAAQDKKEIEADCVDTSSAWPDGSYAVVDDRYCDDDDYYSSHRSSHNAYRWYYGGDRSGTRVRGGTTIKPSGTRITTRTGRVIQRGGFGSRFGGGG